MPQELSANRAKPERPAFVSAYAILMLLGSLQGLISGLCLLNIIVGLGGAKNLVCGVLLLPTIINVVTGIGLWQMKKWGWALEVVRDGLVLALQLLFMAFLMFTLVRSGRDYIPDVLNSPLASMAGLALGGFIGTWFAILAISGFTLYWFWTNRQLFNGETRDGTVVGPDGAVGREVVTTKSSEAARLLAVGGGLVLVYILICVVVLATLATVGPQVGNVFSQITFALDNPPSGVVP